MPAQPSLYDLHSHSTCSDGVLDVSELIQAARTAGVSALALTDHDTVEGLDEAIVHGREAGVEVIPGVEISAYYRSVAIHVLGLFIDHRQSWLREFFQEAARQRIDRIHQIVGRLRALGLEMTPEEVFAQSSHGTVGRPHVARALVAAGHVEDLDEAFDKYLKDDGPAYVGYERLDLSEALSMIHRAGGVSSLAHPIVMKDDELIAPMARQGLMALEVFHVDHSEAKMKTYAELADSLGLLTTGGSDFHFPDEKTGRARLGCRRLTQEHLQRLRHAAASQSPTSGGQSKGP